MRRYILLGSVAISALVANLLSYRDFFTPAAQLRELDASSSEPA